MSNKKYSIYLSANLQNEERWEDDDRRHSNRFLNLDTLLDRHCFYYLLPLHLVKRRIVTVVPHFEQCIFINIISILKLKPCYQSSVSYTMRFLVLLSFSLVGAYTVERVNTVCFFVDYRCHDSHTKEIEVAINKRSGYISHSTTSTKSGMHSIIVYKQIIRKEYMIYFYLE